MDWLKRWWPVIVILIALAMLWYLVWKVGLMY